MSQICNVQIGFNARLFDNKRIEQDLPVDSKARAHFVAIKVHEMMESN